MRRVAAAIVYLCLIAAPALAQTPAATPTQAGLPKPSPPWTYYMAVLTVAVGVLTVILAIVGYLFMAPGFRRTDRPGRPAGPGASTGAAS